MTMRITSSEKEILLTLWNKNNEIRAFVQSPRVWIFNKNLSHLFQTIDWNQSNKILYRLLRIEIFLLILGPAICKGCGNSHQRISQGWVKGWAKTCSSECERLAASTRQLRSNNTCHLMTPQTRENAYKKQSNTMKQKILSGEFTPNSQNYLTHKLITVASPSGEIRNVRSLWELIFWLMHPTLEYETRRIAYFNTKTQREHIYIADFFDSSTNTIYEVKPKKYQKQCIDKQDGAISAGYNFIWVSEDDIVRTPEIEAQIKNVVCNIADIENRLKWIRRKK